jgi:hypothetical protein
VCYCYPAGQEAATQETLAPGAGTLAVVCHGLAVLPRRRGVGHAWPRGTHARNIGCSTHWSCWLGRDGAENGTVVTQGNEAATLATFYTQCLAIEREKDSVSRHRLRPVRPKFQTRDATSSILHCHRRDAELVGLLAMQKRATTISLDRLNALPFNPPIRGYLCANPPCTVYTPTTRPTWPFRKTLVTR